MRLTKSACVPGIYAFLMTKTTKTSKTTKTTKTTRRMAHINVLKFIWAFSILSTATTTTMASFLPWPHRQNTIRDGRILRRCHRWWINDFIFQKNEMLCFVAYACNDPLPVSHRWQLCNIIHNDDFVVHCAVTSFWYHPLVHVWYLQFSK